MALINLKFFSESLGMQSEVYVVMPQKSTKGEIGVNKESNTSEDKYKCLYLLHGLSDDQSIWLRRTSIERYADLHGICVVMPCVHKSFYLNMPCNLNYYDYISNELPRVICQFFNVSEKREDNFIAGNSMGGYGAIKIALKNSDKFCAAVGLSLVSDIERIDFKFITDNIFTGKTPDDEDLFKLFPKHNNDENKPRISIITGTGDYMLDDARRLDSLVKTLDYDYSYKECEGVHDWDFWDKYIQDAIIWMLNK